MCGMKKIWMIMAVLLGLICFTACAGSTTEEDEGYELNGNGLDELITLEVPEGYEAGSTSANGFGGEVISRHWNKDGSELDLTMLSCQEKAVLGTDGPITEYADGDEIVDTVTLDGGVPAYVTYSDGEGEDGVTVKNVDISAVFQYGDYIISLGMMDAETNRTLTREEIDDFYQALRSIGFVPIQEQ